MARGAPVVVALVVVLALALGGAGATPSTGDRTLGVGEPKIVGAADSSQGEATATRTTTTTTTDRTTNDRTTNDRTNGTVVLDGIDPSYDTETVLTRVEELRDLSATDRIVLHEYDDEDGPEIDVRDQFGEIRPPGARALQLYSNASTERRLPLGYTVERGDGVHIYLMNESDLDAYEIDQEVVLAHEFVHALQFQHDLISPSREEFRDYFPRWTTDSQLVSTALVEGDAMWTTEQYLDRHTDGSYAVADYNRTLAREAWPNSVGGTPYYYGYEYYRATGGSPAERTAAIRRPPNSTAELLHPGEPATRAALPDPPESSQEFDELTMYHRDTVGELVIRHALRLNGQSFDRAAAAADGWANDRMYYYTEEATTATHWVSVWENSTEAAEFVAAWRAMLDARGAQVGENGTLVVPTGDDAPAVNYVVERDGATVRITAAPNAGLAERLAETARDSGETGQ